MNDDNLLLVNLAGEIDRTLLQSLSASRGVQVVVTLNAAHAALAKDDYVVGLVIFGADHTAKLCADLSALLRSVCGTVWIAVVQQADLQSTDLSRVLVHDFYDFHHQPLDLPRLQVVVGHATGRARLRQQVRAAALTHEPFSGLLGESAAIKILCRQITKVARVDTPLLICVFH